MTVDRRQFLQVSTAALGAAVLPASLAAKAPLQGKQVPAYYRFKVGDFEVTALNDGVFQLETSLYPSADKAQSEQLLQNAHRAGGKIPTSVNAFLVNTGNALVLIDTGSGSASGPANGKLPANLAAAGIDPATVDAVFLTHLHPDHATGLNTPDGKTAFPNAEIVLLEAEFAFWHDDAIAGKVPAEMKPYFDGARAAVKPYANRTRKISGGEILPGLTAVPAPGHTPGHSMVRVASGSSTLLVWGDIIHTAALQFARPEWAINFDTDQNLAVSTRKKVFDQVAADRVMVAGMHLDFPGVGYVSRETSGYAYHPAFWSPTL